VVYLARDTKLMGKEVVVKILNETALKHPDIVRKFEHEKEALIRLDHPGIVRILDSGRLYDGNPFMVMDYIKGHSLRKALQLAGKLPLEVAANIIESVTDALSAAHSAKILHRDIKPENIMLTPIEEGMYRARLIDFGIARVEESKLAPATEISRAIGSILYISPEQLIGKLDLTPAADIYSFAIVAYEMLTGELPFKPKAIAEMYQLEREGVKTPPSSLRPEVPTNG
jgi:eukaryotic-like serine/threonine-protein kinase